MAAYVELDGKQVVQFVDYLFIVVLQHMLYMNSKVCLYVCTSVYPAEGRQAPHLGPFGASVLVSSAFSPRRLRRLGSV